MFRFALRLSLFLSLASPTARAEELPYRGTPSLGRPLQPVEVKIEATGTLTLGGKTHALKAHGLREASVEAIALAPDAAVAIVRVRADDGAWVGLVGGRTGTELLLFDRTEPVGEPGERRTRELFVTATPLVVRTGIRREGVGLCREPFLFDARRLDGASLTLVAEDGSAAARDASQASLHEAPLTTSSTLTSPVLSGLVATASSELDPATNLPRAPRALIDGDAKTGFALGAGRLAVLRWEGGVVPIERLAIEVAPSAKAGELLWYSDRAEVLRTIVPAHANTARYELTLPEPLAGRCLALLGAGAPVELRELRAYTELDRGAAGLARLIGLLVQDDAQGADAAELLAKLGPDAAEQLAARWPELPPRGKRRGLKVLARGLEREPVRARLIELARDPDRELRAAAVAVLDRGGEPGRAALRTLVAERDGDAAALVLATHPEEAPALLAALAAEGGSERPLLRKALGLAARDRTSFARAVESFRASEPSIAALAALALGVAAADAELANTLGDTYAPRAERFEDRHRFALALAIPAPGEHAASDAWLAHEASDGQEWMQRRAALLALVQRRTSTAAALSEQLAGDPYPRVRAATLAPLVAQGKRERVEQALARDAWPLVRSEAAVALARDAAARPALEGALADRAPSVRRVAIEALTRQGQQTAWPRVAERLRARDEALPVREAAIIYARELCVAEASEPLLAIARTLLAPNESDEQTRLAVEALRALHALGGLAQAAGAELVRETKAPELEALWKRLPPARCEPHHSS